jgi:hypothetical protein
MKKFLAVCFVAGLTLIAIDPTAAANEALRKALTFHASFDQVVDADFALGSKQLYTATSYKKREDAKPGLHHPDAQLVPGAGRFGGALKFAKKTRRLSTTRPRRTWLINPGIGTERFRFG